MRLPIIGEDKSKIDKEKAIEMIRTAIDGGVNYIDTAHPYHEGKSEIAVGKALKDGYRQKVKLATKLPVWLVNESQDFDRFLDSQLKKLQTDYVDFYLLHALDKEKWQKVLDLKLLEKAREAKKDGRIKHICFSFHDDLATFKKIIDGFEDWTMCQIQLNLLDTNFQAGIEGMKYADEKGLAVVVMEPLKGGKLALPPENIKKMWQEIEGVKTAVDGALKWVWNYPQVSLLLSGMSNLVQVTENIKSAEESKIGLFGEKEMKIAKKIEKAYEKIQPIPCTNCQYCLPCPRGVNIPKIFEIYNGKEVFYDLTEAKKMYAELAEKERGRNCVVCKKCEALCPQRIEISRWLAKIDKELPV